MNKKVGIWIDHNRALIVTIENDHEAITKIESNVEAHIRSFGGAGTSTPYGPQEFSVERKVEARRKKHLHQYYQKIIDIIMAGQHIYLIGPGEAKFELEKEMKKSKLYGSKVIKIEACDKITERQIAARIRKYFGS